MTYIYDFSTPIGDITLASNGEALSGLWFKDQKYYKRTVGNDFVIKNIAVFDEVIDFITKYSNGERVVFNGKIAPKGTSFQKRVWAILPTIPYGKTATYKEIAKRIEAETGRGMSAQAVGNAVSKNPISIIIPCHRVIGSDGSLTGYAGGIEKKVRLLKLENALNG